MVSEKENEEREARPEPETEPLIPTPIESASSELEDEAAPSTEAEEPEPEPEPSLPVVESESLAPAEERWDQKRIDRVEALHQAGLSDYLADRPWFDISNPVRPDLKRIIDKMPDQQ